MEKGYRQVKCPGIDCPNILRIYITEQEYGKRLKVTCKRCASEVHVVIPVPIQVEEQAFVTTEESALTALEKLSKKFESFFRKQK